MLPVHLERHKQISALVKSGENHLSGHLLWAFPPHPAVWAGTGTDWGLTETFPAFSSALHPCPGYWWSVSKAAKRKLYIFNSHCRYIQHVYTHAYTNISLSVEGNVNIAICRGKKKWYSVTVQMCHMKTECDGSVKGGSTSFIQSLWLMAKLSPYNSYGWVPAYKIMFHYVMVVNLKLTQYISVSFIANVSNGPHAAQIVYGNAKTLQAGHPWSRIMALAGNTMGDINGWWVKLQISYLYQLSGKIAHKLTLKDLISCLNNRPLFDFPLALWCSQLEVHSTALLVA